MIIAANFKTNHTRSSTRKYLEELNTFVTQTNNTDELYIFPTSASLDKFELNSNITVGTQNAYFVQNGSFTGEIGKEELDEFGIKTILIGHSERRALSDSDDIVAKKFKFYSENKFKIIYCIGENLKIREQGIEAVQKFLYSQLELIDLTYSNLIIAYEPIWAIGTGVSADNETIDETLNILAKKTTNKLLYGGSVKVNSIKNICKLTNCSGVLVGSASWNIKNFFMLISNSR